MVSIPFHTPKGEDMDGYDEGTEEMAESLSPRIANFIIGMMIIILLCLFLFMNCTMILGLKLAGLINWSWMVVLSPYIILTMSPFFLFALGLIARARARANRAIKKTEDNSRRALVEQLKSRVNKEI